MHLAHAFRRIHNNDLELIQQNIPVEVEKRSVKPISFHWNGRMYEILSCLGPFQGELSDHELSFLITTATNEVFLLRETPSQHLKDRKIRHSQWILAFRVLGDEELTSGDGHDPGVLGNAQLKRVSDYHGHVCPDLVVGCKAVNVGLSALRQHENTQDELSIIAQNDTSAVDAIQCLTGCTLGNQRLIIHDHGKHNYTFISRQTHRAAEVRLRNIQYPEHESFCALEKSLENQRGTVHQIARLRVMLDDWIKWLLSLEDEAVFQYRISCRIPPGTESSSRYTSCPVCGDPVLESKTVHHHGQNLCLPCAHWSHYTPREVTWQ